MSQLLVDDIVNKDDTGAPGLSKGVIVTGVCTATSFSGDGSGLVGVASTDNIITGTAATFNNVVKVGTAITMDATSGIITATSFSGDGSNLTFAPKVISFDPQALSTGVVIDKTITITFDQDISFSGTGKVELRSGSSSGTILFEFDIANGTPDAGLSISGTQLIINPASDFPNNTAVYVILPSTGIVNSVGSAYAGSSTYFFQTVVETFSAQGGVEYVLQDGSIPTGYRKYHIFETSGILTTTSPAANGSSLQLLAVGGGGGGGTRHPNSSIAPSQAGGGGGAGGYISKTEATLSLAAGTYTVTIGAGGTGGNHIAVGQPDHRREGEPGEDTTITPPASPTTYLLRAFGGGGGGGEEGQTGTFGDGSGQTGGSGGGGAGPREATQTGSIDGGGNVAGQGYAGSIGVSIQGLVSPTPEDGCSAGGGGGAGGAGSDGTLAGRYWRPSPSTGSDPYPYTHGGTGGSGITNSQFISPVLTNSGLPADKLNVIGANGYYAAGGGGAASGSPVSYGAKGGVGGGGNGCNLTNVLPVGAQETVPSTISPGPYPSVPVGDTFADATGIGCGGGGGITGGDQRGGRGTAGILMISYETPAP